MNPVTGIPCRGLVCPTDSGQNACFGLVAVRNPAPFNVTLASLDMRIAPNTSRVIVNPNNIIFMANNVTSRRIYIQHDCNVCQPTTLVLSGPWGNSGNTVTLRTQMAGTAACTPYNSTGVGLPRQPICPRDPCPTALRFAGLRPPIPATTPVIPVTNVTTGGATGAKNTLSDDSDTATADDDSIFSGNTTESPGESPSSFTNGTASTVPRGQPTGFVTRINGVDSGTNEAPDDGHASDTPSNHSSHDIGGVVGLAVGLTVLCLLVFAGVGWYFLRRAQKKRLIRQDMFFDAGFTQSDAKNMSTGGMWDSKDSTAITLGSAMTRSTKSPATTGNRTTSIQRSSGNPTMSTQKGPKPWVDRSFSWSTVEGSTTASSTTRSTPTLPDTEPPTRVTTLARNSTLSPPMPTSPGFAFSDSARSSMVMLPAATPSVHGISTMSRAPTWATGKMSVLAEMEERRNTNQSSILEEDREDLNSCIE
ncbi:hypothetical protein HK102_008346 [Quaeritorhiza haematococci]|nr:hypothetical protein HK102_008346 [Quaeritorhiza haematococci]